MPPFPRRLTLTSTLRIGEIQASHCQHTIELTVLSYRYENSLQDILYCYSPIINTPLSEAEGFAGTILGKQGGAQGKPLRELSKTMRERFDAVADYYAMRMIHGDEALHETGK